MVHSYHTPIEECRGAVRSIQPEATMVWKTSSVAILQQWSEEDLTILKHNVVSNLSVFSWNGARTGFSHTHLRKPSKVSEIRASNLLSVDSKAHLRQGKCVSHWRASRLARFTHVTVTWSHLLAFLKTVTSVACFLTFFLFFETCAGRWALLIAGLLATSIAKASRNLILLRMNLNLVKNLKNPRVLVRKLLGAWRQIGPYYTPPHWGILNTLPWPNWIVQAIHAILRPGWPLNSKASTSRCRKSLQQDTVSVRFTHLRRGCHRLLKDSLFYTEFCIRH